MQKPAGIWVAVALRLTKPLTDHMAQRFLCVMLQTLMIWICWSSFYKQKYKTWAGCILPQLAEQHQKPGKSQTGFWSGPVFTLPKPLRSEEHPLGLPHLSGIDLVRTQAANQVYEVTARLARAARLLISWGVFVTIENPTNSLFWLVPCIAQLLMDFGGYDCIFDNCCHGGARKKNSRFWGSLPWLLPLAASCPGEHIHKHKNWQPQVVNGKVVYPTAEEAAYPTLLCTRMAEIVSGAIFTTWCNGH